MNKSSRYTPDYFGWGFLFFLDICFLLFWVWIINESLNYEKEYRFDLNGILMAIAAGIIFIWNAYELWILICFLITDMGKTIEFDKTKRTLILHKGGKSNEFKISDLNSVIFNERRLASKTPTANFSYSYLVFKSGETLIVTSFILNTEKMERIVGTGPFQSIFRNRKLFEGIRIPSKVTELNP